MVWCVRYVVPYAQLEVLSAVAEDYAMAVTTSEIDPKGFDPAPFWRVEAYSEDEMDLDGLRADLSAACDSVGLDMPEMTQDFVTDRDWLAEVAASFKPMRLGRFFIYSSYGLESPLPAGCWPIEINAATAFGSGEHETTSGCLLAFDSILKRGKPKRVMDMGAGSGILALAAARATHKRVFAVDIETESTRVSRLNARRNRLSPWFVAETGDGWHGALARQNAPYDLVFANILARPLCKMAKSLRRAVAPGGVIILSGLLVTQEPLVIAAHRQQGFILQRRIRRGDWATLVMRG